MSNSRASHSWIRMKDEDSLWTHPLATGSDSDSALK